VLDVFSSVQYVPFLSFLHFTSFQEISKISVNNDDLLKRISADEETGKACTAFAENLSLIPSI